MGKGRLAPVRIALCASLGACGSFLGGGGEDAGAPVVDALDANVVAASDGGVVVEAGDAAVVVDGAARAPAKKVFVTQAKFSGVLGGVAGGDAKCMAEAKAAGLTGTFVAYLSDGALKPWQRVGSETWTRIDNQVAFVDNPSQKPPLVPIDRTASGSVIAPDAGEGVWTGASAQFGPPQSHCQDADGVYWQGMGSLGSAYGDPSAFGNARWHLVGGTRGCNTPQHLYCFEK